MSLVNNKDIMKLPQKLNEHTQKWDLSKGCSNHIQPRMLIELNFEKPLQKSRLTYELTVEEKLYQIFNVVTLIYSYYNNEEFVQCLDRSYFINLRQQKQNFNCKYIDFMIDL